jgi:tetratricopeptide (TPR) repeat protein
MPMFARRKFDETRLRAALADLVTVVAALHAAGKLHRDLKPQNVLVTHDGVVKVLDFGLVAELGPKSSDDTVEHAGTPAYVAPEQVKGDTPTPAADWYSVGAMLYEALTGAVPFAGKTGPALLVEKLIRDPPAPSTIAVNVPKDLEELALALLRRNAADRPSESEIIASTSLTSSPRSSRSSSTGAPRSPSTSSPATSASAPSLAERVQFVGRAAELTQLELALRDRERSAVVVLVEGESGIGKTALVRRFLDDVVGERRAVALQGRCFEREAVPFKALDGVVDALSRHLHRIGDVDTARALPGDREVTLLGRMFPVLRRVPTIAKSEVAIPDDVSGHELRSRAFGALREVLARLADRQPLVVFIDDFQWADSDSLALLEAIVRPPDAPKILVVATTRGRTVALPGDVRTIALTGLSASESLALVSTSATPDDADRQAIVAEASGHPLFLQELAQHPLRASEAPKLDAVLGARIESLPPDARRLLDVLALAGAPLSLSVAAEAAELSPSSCARIASSLRAQRLARTSTSLESLESYHDRIRAAVVARIDDSRRRDTHQTLAAALENAGAGHDDPQALVGHLEAAGQPSRAAEYARVAAERAQAVLAFDRAVDLFEKSTKLFEAAGDARNDVVIRLGDALRRAGRLRDAAAQYVRAAAALGPRDVDAAFDLRRRATACVLSAGDIDQGNALLRQLTAHVGMDFPRDTKLELVRAVVDLARVRVFPPAPHIVRPSEVATAVKNRALLAQTIGTGFFLMRPAYGNFAWRALIRVIDEPCDEFVLAIERVFRTSMKAALGASRTDLDNDLRALSDYIAKIEDAEQRQWVSDRCALSLLLASRYADSVAWLDRAQSSAAKAQQWSHENFDAHIWRLVCLDRLGRFRELREEVPRLTVEAERRGNHLAQLFFSSGYASGGWLAADAPERAKSALDAAVAHFDLHNVPYLQIYELQTLVRTAAYEGRASSTWTELDRRYEALVEDPALRLSRGAAANFEHMRACLAAAALGESVDDRARRSAFLARLRSSAKALAKLKLPLGDAHASVALAALAAQTGDRDGARTQLTRASALFSSLEMTAYAAAAQRALGVVANDAALVDQGSAALIATGVVDATKMARILVPGIA